MRTRARRDGSDWVLNGTKMWITNGNLADVATVWAHTDDGIRGFLVPTDTPGFTANAIHKKLSLRASVTSELVLDNVRLPASAQLPSPKAWVHRCRASTRPGSASSSAPSVPRGTAWRPPSPTPNHATSSTARCPATNSPRKSWPI